MLRGVLMFLVRGALRTTNHEIFISMTEMATGQVHPISFMSLIRILQLLPQSRITHIYVFFFLSGCIMRVCCVCGVLCVCGGLCVCVLMEVGCAVMQISVDICGSV